MLIELENANHYYLKSLEVGDFDYYIGGRDEMNVFASLLNEGDVFLTTGVMNETCFLITDFSEAKCDELMVKFKELLESRTVIDGELIGGVQ